MQPHVHSLVYQFIYIFIDCFYDLQGCNYVTVFMFWSIACLVKVIMMKCLSRIDISAFCDSRHVAIRDVKKIY